VWCKKEKKKKKGTIYVYGEEKVRETKKKGLGEKNNLVLFVCWVQSVIFLKI
jgi:hypothetical protein